MWQLLLANIFSQKIAIIDVFSLSIWGDFASRKICLAPSYRFWLQA